MPLAVQLRSSCIPESLKLDSVNTLMCQILLMSGTFKYKTDFQDRVSNWLLLFLGALYTLVFLCFLMSTAGSDLLCLQVRRGVLSRNGHPWVAAAFGLYWMKGKSLDLGWGCRHRNFSWWLWSSPSSPLVYCSLFHGVLTAHRWVSHGRALLTGPRSGEDAEQTRVVWHISEPQPLRLTDVLLEAAGGCCRGDTTCKTALAPRLIVQARAPLVLAAHMRGGTGAGALGRKSTGAAHQLLINSSSLIKIFKAVGELKNQESAVSSSLLRKSALGILWFVLDMEGVCTSSN